MQRDPRAFLWDVRENRLAAYLAGQVKAIPLSEVLTKYAKHSLKI